jgi:hypothetical protein
MCLTEHQLEDLGIGRRDIFGSRALHTGDTRREPATLRLDRIPIVH